MKVRGYIASHFFNQAMFSYTEALADYLERHCDIELYVPQRNASINDKRSNDATITDIAIAEADTRELRRANLLIANIDGLSIDDGVAGEIMAHGVMAELESDFASYGVPKIQRRIIGLITDMRYLGTGDNKLYRNLMIIGKIKQHGCLLHTYPGDADAFEKIATCVNQYIDEIRAADTQTPS